MHNSFLYCEGCSATIHFPQWIYVGDGEYRAFCRPCVIELERQFTPEAAIAHAECEVWIWSSAPVRPYRPRLERTLRRVGGR